MVSFLKCRVHNLKYLDGSYFGLRLITYKFLEDEVFPYQNESIFQNSNLKLLINDRRGIYIVYLKFGNFELKQKAVFF